MSSILYLQKLYIFISFREKYNVPRKCQWYAAGDFFCPKSKLDSSERANFLYPILSCFTPVTYWQINTFVKPLLLQCA